MKAIFLMGKPFSGKSTLARKLLIQDMLYVNRDTIRESLLMGGYPHAEQPFDQLSEDHPARRFERVVRQTAKTMVQEALQNGFSVLIDETNLTRFRRDFWREVIREVCPDCQIHLYRCQKEYPCQPRRGYSAKEWETIRQQMVVEPVTVDEGFKDYENSYFEHKVNNW